MEQRVPAFSQRKLQYEKQPKAYKKQQLSRCRIDKGTRQTRGGGNGGGGKWNIGIVEELYEGKDNVI